MCMCDILCTDSQCGLQCGGEKGAIAAAEPYLKLMGKTVINCGQSGNGQAAKVALHSCTTA